MAAPSKILVPNVWNPSSNRYLIISPSSSSESLSAHVPVNHHALKPWRIDNPFESNKSCGTLEHSYSPMVSSRLTSFHQTACWWRRCISMTTSLISCYFCFCSTVWCYWGCSSSNMRSHTSWTLSCHSNISGAQFCKYFPQFPEF